MQSKPLLKIDPPICYVIGNYQLCPSMKTISVGKIIRTEISNDFDYFYDSTLKYDEQVLVAFGDLVFFDNPKWNIDWEKAQLLASSNFHYPLFVYDGFIYEHQIYNIIRKEKYDKEKYDRENVLTPWEKEIMNNRPEYKLKLKIKNNKLYIYDYLVLESFDLLSLHQITSQKDYKTFYMSDGKNLLYCDFTEIETVMRNNRQYITQAKNIIENVDFPTLRILNKNLLIDKNAFYNMNVRIPFDKLNGLKFIAIERQ